jgi:hypothetical protein
MKETAEDLIRRLHRDEVERARREGLPTEPAEPPGIPCTDLPEASPDSPLFIEWNTYRREVGRLLAEGGQGRFALIKGELVVGLYPTEREALEQGYRMFPCQAFLVHRVQEREPLLHPVSVRLCRS